MRMDPPLKVAMLLLLLRYAYASQFMDDFGQCEKVVKEWAFSSVEQDAKEDKHTLEDLLFFLHVPRTGGRTYHHCFLRKLYPNYQECPRSYDRLRFDPSKKECRLLVTHDDYSMMSKLPRERTSVVTILRNPVDRVFSTYEFSIEVAARFLIHPNISSAKQMTRRVRIRPGAVSTLDIWPWKYLVPWMREDLFSRREDRESDGLRIMSSDPYNMKEIVMPLHEYINDPIAHDVVHNGATFQVAGLTNNSYAPEAHKVRHCVQKYKSLSEDVLMVAKKRLDDMLYVGLTENHKESATMFANVVGAQVISQASASNSSSESTMDKGLEHRSSVLESEPETDDHQVGLSDQKTTEAAPEGNLEEEKETMTVEKLMTAYEGCINTLRKTQSRRRTSSLKKIAPANFSKLDRLQVSERVIEEIKALNDLDLELYKYAVNLFAKQHEQMAQKLADIESWEGGFFRDGDVLVSWKILVSVVTPVSFLLVLLFYFVNSRRRMFKIKI